MASGRALASGRAVIGIMASAFREGISITMTVGISEASASGKTLALGKGLASWYQYSRHEGKKFTI